MIDSSSARLRAIAVRDRSCTQREQSKHEPSIEALAWGQNDSRRHTGYQLRSGRHQATSNAAEEDNARTHARTDLGLRYVSHRIEQGRLQNVEPVTLARPSLPRAKQVEEKSVNGGTGSWGKMTRQRSRQRWHAHPNTLEAITQDIYRQGIPLPDRHNTPAYLNQRFLSRPHQLAFDPRLGLKGVHAVRRPPVQLGNWRRLPVAQTRQRVDACRC